MRRITNMIQRRILMLEENLEYDDSIKIIQGLNGVVGIQFNYSNLVGGHVERGLVTSEQAERLAKLLFQPEPNTYLEARRQIFTNGTIEKNYLDIMRGLYIDVGNKRMSNAGPISKFTLEYFTKKD